MGDPRKTRKKYSPPRHPWEKTRIEEEKILKKDYGFGNKKEIWKVNSKLKNFKDQSKKLAAGSGKQVDLETKQLLQKLRNLNLLAQDQELNDILGLGAGSVSDRRLQTIVFKRNLARSMKQARQMIVHRHISVNGVKITSPSYMVNLKEEATVNFAEDSPFFSVDHPERINSEDSIAQRPEEKEELALKKEHDAKRAEATTTAKDSENKSETKQEKKQEPKVEEKKEETKEDTKEGKKEESPKETVKKEEISEQKSAEVKKE